MTRSKEADEQLLVEAAKKDRSHFAQLYETHFERVYAYVAARVRNRDEAEDLTAEVFHKAFDHLDQFELRGAPFVAWLYRIAVNAIADHCRAQAREASGRNPTAAQERSVQHPGPEELEEIERRAQLIRLVNALPDDQRRVVQMRFSEEKSVREIAEALGRTEGAVKQLQFRALQRLRTRLAKTPGGAHA